MEEYQTVSNDLSRLKRMEIMVYPPPANRLLWRININGTNFRILTEEPPEKMPTSVEVDVLSDFRPSHLILLAPLTAKKIIHLKCKTLISLCHLKARNILLEASECTVRLDQKVDVNILKKLRNKLTDGLVKENGNEILEALVSIHALHTGKHDTKATWQFFGINECKHATDAKQSPPSQGTQKSSWYDDPEGRREYLAGLAQKRKEPPKPGERLAQLMREKEEAEQQIRELRQQEEDDYRAIDEDESNHACLKEKFSQYKQLLLDRRNRK